MKWKLPFFISLMAFLFFSWKFIQDKKVFTERDHPSMEIMLRNVGHQLLLKAGDSTSRVLPLLKQAENTFTIRFENSFSIVPDTLVNVIITSMNELGYQGGYLVNVKNCSSGEVVYGFEIYKESAKDMVPCLGRLLPRECYEISILFSQQRIAVHTLVFLVLSLVASLGFGIVLFRQNKKATVSDGNELVIPLGKIKFYPEKQTSKTEGESIELTAKENHVLKILASNTNEILSRDQLQKEVWEDEGVLVGRSLDVFISKLRKKLEADPKIRIVNIHGKGYKLEI